MYRPWTQRSIGVEMETNTSTTAGGHLAEAVVRRAVQAAAPSNTSDRGGYYHSNGRTWDVKSDGSCGWEIASPALRLDDAGHNAQLEAVCRALQGLRPTINRNCGLHVHVDCNDFNWQDLQRLLSLWCRYEPFFFSLLPPSRSRNTFCPPLRRAAWNGMNSGLWANMAAAIGATSQRDFERHARVMGRYAALNISGWWTHGRVEFRLHSGTVSYEKVRHWAMLVASVVARAKHPTMPTPRRVKYEDAPMATHFTGHNPTTYVCKVLGLMPSTQCPDVPEESTRLVAWAEARRRQFDTARTSVGTRQVRAGAGVNLPEPGVEE